MASLDDLLNESVGTPARPRTGPAGGLDALLAESVGAAPASSTATVPRSLRASDPQRRATNFERFLNALQTSNFATAGAVEAATQLRNPLAGAAQGIREHTTFRDVIQNLGEAHPWLKTPEGLPRLGLNPFDDPTGAGLAADVALDPLNALGLGVMTKAGRAAKAAEVASHVANLSGDAARVAEAARATESAGTLGKTLAEQARLGQRALVSFGEKPLIKGAPVYDALERLGKAASETEFGKALNEAFRVASQLKGTARDVYLQRLAQVRAASTVGQRMAVDALREPAQAVYGLARKYGLNPRSLHRALSDAVELAKPGAGEDAMGAVARSVDASLSLFPDAARQDLAPHVQDLVNRINATNAANLAATQAAGVPITALGDEAINYLRHKLRPEAERAIREAGGGNVERGLSRLITEKHGAQAQRAFTGMTITQINDLAEAGRLSILGNKPLKGGLFVEDPILATVIRSGEAGKSIESAKMLADYARAYGAPAASAPAGWRTVPNEIAGIGKDVAFPPEVAQALTTHFQKIVNPDAPPGAFLRAYDTAQKTWARHTIGILPATQTRNLVGDVWSAVMLGGMDPSRFGDASNALRFGTKLGAGLRSEPTYTLAGKAWKSSELKALGERMGIFGGGEVQQLMDELGALKAAPASATEAMGRGINAAVAPQWMAKASKAREDVTRLAFFMDRLGKGDTPEVAALAVKKHLFDYGELTATEQQVLKRVFPFYSWMRNNLPLQIYGALAKPGALAAVQKVRTATGGEQGLGLGAAPLPRFLREGMPLRWWDGPGGQAQYLRLLGYLPAADLGQYTDPAQAFQTLVGNTSPFIQTPLGMAANIDPFHTNWGEGDVVPLEENPGETQNFMGLPVSRRWALPVLRSIRGLNEIDRLNPGNVFGTRAGGPFGAPRAGQEVDPMTRLVNLLAGRVYAADPEREMSRLMRQQARERAGYLAKYRQYLRNGDTANARRVMALIEQMGADPYASQ